MAPTHTDSTRKSQTSRGPIVLLVATLLLMAAMLYVGRSSGDAPVRLPEPALDQVAKSPGGQETAVFAGGCFWGVQAVFQHTRGVLNAVSGYAGGQKETARYESVGSGQTGHAEAVQISYDPKQVSYGKLLQIYFSVAHDPTEINRQGPDSGTQYRSAIFYQSAEQKQVAERYISQLDAAKMFSRKIATQLTSLDAFYPAEDYHQDYATLNPHSVYIATYDLPKIANLKSLMPEVYREAPVLVASQAATAGAARQ